MIHTQGVSSVVGPGVSLPFPHGLGQVPDHVILENTTSSAITPGTPFFDAVNIYVDDTAAGPTSVAWTAFGWTHSIEDTAIVATKGQMGTYMYDATVPLTGTGAPDVFPHPIAMQGQVPDYVFIWGNYNQLMVPIICTWDDAATTITAVGAFSDVVTYTLMKFHSVNSYPYLIKYVDRVVPWSGGPAGNRLIVHNSEMPPYAVGGVFTGGVTPEIQLVDGITDANSVYFNGAVTKFDSNYYTAAGADVNARLVFIHPHSIVA